MAAVVRGRVKTMEEVGVAMVVAWAAAVEAAAVEAAAAKARSVAAAMQMAVVEAMTAIVRVVVGVTEVEAWSRNRPRSSRRKLCHPWRRQRWTTTAKAEGVKVEAATTTAVAVVAVATVMVEAASQQVAVGRPSLLARCEWT